MGARLSWVVSCSSPSGSICCYTGKNFFYVKFNSSYPRARSGLGKNLRGCQYGRGVICSKKKGWLLFLCCCAAFFCFQSFEPTAAAGQAESINLPEILCRRLGAWDLRLSFKKMGKSVIKACCFCCCEVLAQPYFSHVAGAAGRADTR